jgi:hypothetical protein
MLRRIIYLVALALGSATLGYGFALRDVDPERAAAEPPAPTAQPTAAETSSAVDWTRITDDDLRVAQVFLVAKTVGVEAALDSLQAMARGSADITRRGHQLAHALGRVTIAHHGNDPAVLARCRPLFQAGCYHGVLEGYLQSVSEVDARELTGFCAALAEPGKAIIDARECAHGLGHGLLERVSYDFGPALRACDAFRSEALREECHDGVFMQNLVTGEGLPTAGASDVVDEASAEGASHQHAPGAHAASGAASQSSGFRADDLTFPCSTVDDEYQPSCWSYQPVAIRRFLSDAGPRAMFACDLAAESARSRCYAGYGKQSLARWNNDEQTLIELCTLALPPNDDACLGGVVELLIDRQWAPDNALAFCERVEAFGKDPTSCYGTLGERISLLHAQRAETEAVCARAGGENHVTACLRGAGVRR